MYQGQEKYCMKPEARQRLNFCWLISKTFYKRRLLYFPFNLKSRTFNGKDKLENQPVSFTGILMCKYCTLLQTITIKINISTESEKS